MDLTGKKVLITNILSALGMDIARVVADAGALVVGGYHQETPDDEAMLDGDPPVPSFVTVPIPYGSGDIESSRGLIGESVLCIGEIDAVIILPYAQPRTAFLDQTEDDWDQGLAINAAGMHYVGQAAAIQMACQETPGSIVYISTVASEMPFHEVSLYATTLAAINTIAQVAAIELGALDITVNVVAPGWLQSGENGPLTFAGAEFPYPSVEDIDHVTTGVPLGRIGQTTEVGELCAFLISDRARYISGAYIPIDGAYAITKTAGNTPYPDGEPWMPFDSGYDPHTSET